MPKVYVKPEHQFGKDGTCRNCGLVERALYWPVVAGVKQATIHPPPCDPPTILAAPNAPGSDSRLLLCGWRDWSDEGPPASVLDQYDPRRTVILEGGYRGLDLIVRKLALERGFVVWEYPAEWRTYGPAAGPRRNRWMLEAGRPTLVYAFHHNHDDFRSGTFNMCKIAEREGVPVVKLPFIIHALHGGFAVCGFSLQSPGDWPVQHKWDVSGTVSINCPECLRRGSGNLPPARRPTPL